jgi:hypothetical protein
MLPDGTGEPLHGVLILPVVQRQQTHQVQRVRVIGIRRERLPAAQLRIGVSSGLHISKAGFAKSGGNTRA